MPAPSTKTPATSAISVEELADDSRVWYASNDDATTDDEAPRFPPVCSFASEGTPSKAAIELYTRFQAGAASEQDHEKEALQSYPRPWATEPSNFQFMAMTPRGQSTVHGGISHLIKPERGWTIVAAAEGHQPSSVVASEATRGGASRRQGKIASTYVLNHDVGTNPSDGDKGSILLHLFKPAAAKNGYQPHLVNILRSDKPYFHSSADDGYCLTPKQETEMEEFFGKKSRAD